ncbi:MAG: histone family protein [archaeon]
MGRNTTVIPKAPVARILLNAGAKRVSNEALEAFADLITEHALHIGTLAARIARHSGRKTVQEGDIKLAAR